MLYVDEKDIIPIVTNKKASGEVFHSAYAWLGRWYDLRTFDEDIECDPQEIRALFNNVLDKGTYETYN
jgi:hypothetical protein